MAKGNWRDIIPSKENLTDRDKKQRFQLVLVSFIFFVVGLVFTVMNFTQGEYTLGYITLSFSALSFAICILSVFFKKGILAFQIAFSLATLILFTSFVITGGASDTQSGVLSSEGFSTYWLLILPFTAMLVLGLLKGSITSGIMFFVLIVFLWMPSGLEVVNKFWLPSNTFCLRFPFVYLAAFAVSFFFELSRYYTGISYEETRNKLKVASETDYLTGLHNRLWLSEYLKEKQSTAGRSVVNIYCCMVDIDNFKLANDKYGHLFGDEILVALSNILRKYDATGEMTIRFGGDEFLIIGTNTGESALFEMCEKIRQEAEDISFESHPEYHFTLSIGIAISAVDTKFKLSSLIELADAQSARAKTHGKNRVYSVNYNPENRKITENKY